MIAAAEPTARAACSGTKATPHPPESRRPYRKSGLYRLKAAVKVLGSRVRVSEGRPLTDLLAGADPVTHLVATIEDPPVVPRILRHLGLPTDSPVPDPARAPPARPRPPAPTSPSTSRPDPQRSPTPRASPTRRHPTPRCVLTGLLGARYAPSVLDKAGGIARLRGRQPSNPPRRWKKKAQSDRGRLRLITRVTSTRS